MNQQTNMAAEAAADLVRQIARKLYGAAGADVTDLITLANRVLADVGNPVSPAPVVIQNLTVKKVGLECVAVPAAVHSGYDFDGKQYIATMGEAIATLAASKPVLLDSSPHPLGYTAPMRAAPPAQAVDVGQQVARYRIEDTPGLDPITVYVENRAPGQGRLLVACYGTAWTAYWGAMGSATTIEAFVAGCNPHYVADNLVWGTEANKRQRAYANKVAAAVVGYFKSQRDSQAVGNG